MRHVICCMLLWTCWAGRGLAAEASAPADDAVTIMSLGDSITQGGKTFVCYRLPLMEKLAAAGYRVRSVGSQAERTRLGELRHDGYGGRTAEYLAANIERWYRANPADIVLLHAGHNHFIDEKPVAGIIAAHEKIIHTVGTVRPDAVILVAQVIPAGKLPKYAYVPELNAELAKLAERMKAGRPRVILVNQADGFDWQTDTVADKVHPNAAGAEKMARKWFDALAGVLPAPRSPATRPATTP